MMLACPIAEYRGTLRALDGFEYVGEGLRIAHLRHPEVVPVLFDRAGNHPDNSRCVGFANWSEDGPDGGGIPAGSAYGRSLWRVPQSTLRELRVEEPWLLSEGGNSE